MRTAVNFVIVLWNLSRNPAYVTSDTPLSVGVKTQNVFILFDSDEKIFFYKKQLIIIPT